MTEKDTVNIKQELKKALPFITIIILVCLANKFLIFNTTIPTSSMVSTLNIGDCLFGNRLTYIFSNPKRGDIITFKAPDDEDTIYVKRVIGIEGDTIKINNGYVWRNNELLNEEYIHEPMNHDGFLEVFEVPKGCVFVMGDNRNNSFDARYWNNHYVSKDKIISKLGMKYYDGEKKQFYIKWVR